MIRTFLTRAAEFPAGHRYVRADWTESENEARFGRCYRPPGHGHNYRVEVTVSGNVALTRVRVSEDRTLWAECTKE
ncbi:MAG: 6-carboxytetrahydropterin synthase [Gemmatimonadetes bacterium]|nr:6-carboxytetrahydropterin synthase [Gemmatimonadota bacterium]